MAALSAVLLHITTLAGWSAAAVSGSYGRDQIETDGFVHLSTPEQVALPANALFAGRDDAWLLVIDEARLREPVRWEPGDSSDPDGMRFPHLYAPLPARAVVAAVPYEPGPDGSFGRPVNLPAPDDQLGRAYALEWYLARAGASLVGEVGDPFGVRHPDAGRSDQHNRLVLHRDDPPAEAARRCARELGAANWLVRIDGVVTPATIDAYELAGWHHAENVIMVAGEARTDPRDPEVLVTELAGAAPADSPASLRSAVPRLMDPQLRQLVEREAVTGGVARHLHHAVLGEDGQPMSQADLLVAGATAQLDNVVTAPEDRGQGLASAIIRSAVARGRDLGCDVIFLRTAVAEGTWRTYERLGFRTLGTAHDFDRSPFLSGPSTA